MLQGRPPEMLQEAWTSLNIYERCCWLSIDPDELLIFKKRSAIAEGGKAQRDTRQPTAEPQRDTQQPKTKPQPTPLPQPKPQPQLGHLSPEQNAQRQPQTTVAAPPVVESAAPAESQAEDAEQTPTIENIACTNHPWRFAYKFCDHCGRPFCYADMINFHGKTYCLEDIDYAAQIPVPMAENPTLLIYLTSILFVFSSVLLMYLIYVPTSYLVVSLMHAGISGLLISVITQYEFIIANLALVVLGLAASLVIIRHTKSAFIFSGAVLFLMLVILSYEYMNSNAQYLYLALAASIINIIALSMSRMSTVGMNQINKVTEGLEWPKPELF